MDPNHHFLLPEIYEDKNPLLMNPETTYLPACLNVFQEAQKKTMSQDGNLLFVKGLIMKELKPSCFLDSVETTLVSRFLLL